MGIVHNPPITEKGWHGSETRIKIMPSDFIQNDDYNRGTIQVAYDAGIAGGVGFGLEVSNSSLEVYAGVPIPTGYKATGLKIAGTDTANKIWAWEACVVGCALINLFDDTGLISLMGANKFVGTEYDFDGADGTGANELTSGVTNYLLVWVELEATTDVCYGGYVNIEKV